MKRASLILVTLFIVFFFPKQLLAKDFDQTSHDWYFKLSEDGKRVTTEPEYLEMLENHNGIFMADSQEKELFLTFDNGYEAGHTAAILDTLKKRDVPATFFVTGHYLQEEPELVKRMVKEGHIVGNHSFNHPDLTVESNETIREELESVETLFTQITGKSMPKYLRPPRGIFSERTLAVSNALGYTNVFWSLAYKDWEIDKQKGEQYAYDQIMRRIHPGAIMLLHTVSRDNAEALDRVIVELQKQGYTFRSLDEYMVRQVVPDWLLTP